MYSTEKKKTICVSVLLLLLSLDTMGHKCNEDDCKRDSVTGPATKCRKCDAKCFLLCYGFEKAKYNHVKIILSTGAKIAVDTNSLIFVCDNCDVTMSNVIPKPTEKNDTPNASKLSPKKATIASLATEFREWSKDISSKCEKIQASLNFNNTINAKKQPITQKQTPILSARISNINVNKTKPRQFSTILKSTVATTSNGTATPGKRKYSEITLIENASSKVIGSAPIPSPKHGTGNVQIGKPLVVQPTKAPKSPKQRMEKSVWISKFHPDTTVDEINAHILSKTSITDTKKFRCIKLVKKDQDMNKLSFVSFKIDVVNEHFDELMDAATWSSRHLIREHSQRSICQTHCHRVNSRHLSGHTKLMICYNSIHRKVQEWM